MQTRTIADILTNAIQKIMNGLLNQEIDVVTFQALERMEMSVPLFHNVLKIAVIIVVS